MTRVVDVVLLSISDRGHLARLEVIKNALCTPERANYYRTDRVLIHIRDG